MRNSYVTTLGSYVVLTTNVKRKFYPYRRAGGVGERDSLAKQEASSCVNETNSV